MQSIRSIMRVIVSGKDVARYACAGVITPDHVIRTKPWPLIAPAPEAGKLNDFNCAKHACLHRIDAY